MPLTRILEKGKRKRIKMGMAASQVRYLALQNRNNTIGLNLMTLANRRTALERDMSRVAKLYNEAMNEKMLKLSTDSGVSYKDLSYDSLMKSSAGVSKLPFIITDANGRAVLDDTELIVNGKNTGYSYKDLAQIISGYKGKRLTGEASFAQSTNSTPSTSGNGNENYVSGQFLYGLPNEHTIEDATNPGVEYNPLKVELFTKLGFIDNTFENGQLVTAYKINNTTHTLSTPLNAKAFLDTYCKNQNINSENIEECTMGDKSTKTINEVTVIATNIGTGNIKTILYSVSQTPEMKYFDAIFKYIAENGWVYDDTINNPNRPSQSRNALQEKLRNNIYYLTEAMTESLDDSAIIGYDTKIALNTNMVYDTYDTAAQNAALATYEAEKADIQAKEKQVDLRMSRLETEQSAIKTELDSIKSIINDNVNSTFKIFG